MNSTASQGALALLGSSMTGAQNLYGTENEAANSMFGAQNTALPQFMNYDTQLRGLGLNSAHDLSQLWQQNLGLGSQLGSQEFGLDQQNLDAIYQEWLRTQPAYSPYLSYLYSAATAQPIMYQPSYQPSGFSQIAGGVGELLKGIGGLGGSGGLGALLKLSDRRLKENIRDSQRGLDEIAKIRVRDYNFRGSDKTEQGFIAQELNEVYPDAVHPSGDAWRVDYGRLTPLLVKAVQELAAEVKALRAAA